MSVLDWFIVGAMRGVAQVLAVWLLIDEWSQRWDEDERMRESQALPQSIQLEIHSATKSELEGRVLYHGKR